MRVLCRFNLYERNKEKKSIKKNWRDKKWEVVNKVYKVAIKTRKYH